MTELTIEALRRILAGMDVGNEADFNEVAALALSLLEQLQQERAGREAAEKIMDDAQALWKELGHPMLLAARTELVQRRAALQPAPQAQAGEGV